jgi:esterase
MDGPFTFKPSKVKFTKVLKSSFPCELSYRETGDRSNHAIVLLHGLFASTQNWQSVSKRLKIDFNVFNVDLPNHGLSPRTDIANYQEMVDGVVSLIENLNRPVHLLGHSMGGKVAMMVCLQRPGLVSKLIVEDIAPKTYPQWFAPIIRALANVPIGSIQSRMEADQCLKEDIPDLALRMFLLTNLTRNDQGRFEWRVNLDALIRGGAEVAGFPCEPGFSEMPALWINGGLSEYVKTQDEDLIRSRFPKAEIHCFKGADHWVHARHPDAFSDRVREFLNRP